MPALKPKILLFDLGGVIVPWTGIGAIEQLTGLSAEQIGKKFSGSDIISAYEIGQCSDDEFAREMISQFNFDMDLNGFKAAWQSWVLAPYAGTLDMFSQLRPDYHLACLSNTNALHWAGLDYLYEHLDCAMASHELGLAKPNPEIYQRAYEILGGDANIAPEDIWFFDDSPVNVTAAAHYGFSSFQVDSQYGVIPTLKRLELI